MSATGPCLTILLTGKVPQPVAYPLSFAIPPRVQASPSPPANTRREHSSTMNWQTLATASLYRTAVAVQQELQAGHIAEATTGIEELIEALSKSERRALKSQLVRLMLHILKWQVQPERRSLSWAASIADARDEIGDIREETPSLNDAVVATLWDKAFAMAKRDAEAEMGSTCDIEGLTWQAVFETAYTLSGDQG